MSEIGFVRSRWRGGRYRVFGVVPPMVRAGALVGAVRRFNNTNELSFRLWVIGRERNRIAKGFAPSPSTL